ncbi:hypothetical protein CANCADRAFT_90605 [Tortispora caseinolytica NRRL Y-17796]|uniref:histidinol-phosphate transaminase n=1 Tax=Tortispora caseinolytica NRRL Y-17796 TaxID=767744 RepID=A0A1E4TLR6_9ASCO|nr:hypothetical protein CANCADRAFT_90605 [Tortispora caseinolytica NRRL Y-17796]
MGFDLQQLARPNILKLKPYRCARDDYSEGVLLDANENAYGSSADFAYDGKNLSLHRYPDPRQEDVKSKMCALRNVQNTDSTLTPLDPANMFVGVGSDEVIDALIRCFCVPGRDKILVCPPTYGMYSVCADINDVGVVKVPLDASKQGFPLRTDAVVDALKQDPAIKILFLCSPGNPTAGLIDPAAVQQILSLDWNGIVMLDEAYIDFSAPGSSLAPWVTKYPNLVVSQTLSKAFGMAGIRIGMAFGNPEVIALMNNMKAPYNVSSLASEAANRALDIWGIKLMLENVTKLNEQRDKVYETLQTVPGVGNVIGGFDANFLLFQVLDRNGNPSSETALKVYEKMAQIKGVVIRYRGNEYGCEGGLRATIGTAEENQLLLTHLRETIQEVHDETS